MTIGYLGIRNVATQIRYSKDILESFGPICAKGAMREFQTENMKVYQDNGAISSDYYNYLHWLQGDSEFRKVAEDLLLYKDLEMNPSNFSVPYLSRNKLEKLTDEMLKKQAMLHNEQDRRSSITDTEVEILKFSKEIKNFSNTKEIWGKKSDFYNNTSGHTKLYEYDKYVSYCVRFKVTGKILCRMPWLKNAVIKEEKLTYEFDIPYELIN